MSAITLKGLAIPSNIIDRAVFNELVESIKAGYDYSLLRIDKISTSYATDFVDGYTYLAFHEVDTIPFTTDKQIGKPIAIATLERILDLNLLDKRLCSTVYHELDLVFTQIKLARL